MVVLYVILDRENSRTVARISMTHRCRRSGLRHSCRTRRCKEICWRHTRATASISFCPSRRLFHLCRLFWWRLFCWRIGLSSCYSGDFLSLVDRDNPTLLGLCWCCVANATCVSSTPLIRASRSEKHRLLALDMINLTLGACVRHHFLSFRPRLP